jgi:transposase
MALRRYLGADQPGHPRTPQDPPQKGPPAQRGRGRFPGEVKSTAVGGEDRGYDGGKKLKGRKRHLLVDTEGLVLKAKVHSAKVMDYEGIKTLLRKANEHFPRLCHLWLDAGYRGEDKGKDWALRRRWAGAPSSSRAHESPPRKRCSDEVDQGVGQRRREARLAEAVAAQGLRGAAEEVGGGDSLNANDKNGRAHCWDRWGSRSGSPLPLR